VGARGRGVAARVAERIARAKYPARGSPRASRDPRFRRAPERTAETTRAPRRAALGPIDTALRLAAPRARDADAADPATTRAVTEEEITAAILFEAGGGWMDVWCVRVCRSDGRTARARLFPTSSVTPPRGAHAGADSISLDKNGHERRRIAREIFAAHSVSQKRLPRRNPKTHRQNTPGKKGAATNHERHTGAWIVRPKPCATSP